MGESFKKKILITGSSGFLGRKFLEEFARGNPEAGIRLLVHQKDPQIFPQNPNLIKGSLSDGKSLERAVIGIDSIIHFAGKTHARSRAEYFGVNYEGTVNLIREAKKARVSRFIYISTRAINDECGDYGISKFKAEQALRESGISYLIFRPSEVYGENSREGLGVLIKLAASPLPIIPYPAQNITIAPLFIEDAIAAIIRAVENDGLKNKIYNLTGPRSYSFRQALNIILKNYSKKKLLIPVPIFALRLFGYLTRNRHPIFYYDQIDRLLCKKDDNIQDAKQDLDFNPLPLEDGLKLIIS